MIVRAGRYGQVYTLLNPNQVKWFKTAASTIQRGLDSDNVLKQLVKLKVKASELEPLEEAYHESLLELKQSIRSKGSLEAEVDDNDEDDKMNDELKYFYNC